MAINTRPHYTLFIGTGKAELVEIHAICLLEAGKLCDREPVKTNKIIVFRYRARLYTFTSRRGESLLTRKLSVGHGCVKHAAKGFSALWP